MARRPAKGFLRSIRHPFLTSSQAVLAGASGIAVALCCVAFAVSCIGVGQRALFLDVDTGLEGLFGMEVEGPSVAGGTAGASPSSEPSSDQGATQAAPTASSLFAALRIPAASEIASAAESASGDPSPDASPGAGGGGTDAGGGAPPSGPVPEPEEQPSGISEEQEQAWLSQLRANYDTLGGYYSRTSSGWQEFLQIAGTCDEATREQRASVAAQLFYETSVTHNAITELQVPEQSRYYADYQTLLQLNYDIDSAAALLRQAWFRYCLSPDDREDWMTPYNVNSVNGKITFLADFESLYPGARP